EMGAVLRGLRPVGEYVGQRDRDQKMGRAARLSIFGRRDFELPHAARACRDPPPDTPSHAYAISGRGGAATCRTVVVERADDAAYDLRICQADFRPAAHGDQPWRASSELT